jgi:hypothetical protein
MSIAEVEKRVESGCTSLQKKKIYLENEGIFFFANEKEVKNLSDW